MKHVFYPKAVAALLLLLALVAALCACGQSAPPASATPALTGGEPSAAPAPSASAEKEIPFQYLYRGFSAIRREDTEAFSAFDWVTGERIIQTEEAWHDFMAAYCPGIFYDVSVDFSDECLLAVTSMGAKSTFATMPDILAIRVSGGELQIQLEFDTDAGVYALNTGETTHFALNIVVVRRSDLPADPDEDIVYTGMPDETDGETVSQPVHITLATDDLLDEYDTYHEFVSYEEGFWFLVRTDTAVQDFSCFSVDHDVERDTISLSVGEVLISLDALTPEKPFAIKMMTPEVLPLNGISFRDEDGVERFFAIQMSGESGDQPYFLQEFENPDKKS